MNSIESFVRFRDIFLENVRLRSRTVKGDIHTNVSALKLPLLLKGRELQEQLDVNLRRTAEILHDGVLQQGDISPAWCKNVFDVWFDQLQDGLLDVSGYDRERNVLGLPSFNPRYRIWEVNYDPKSPKPEKIGECMQSFREQLVGKMSLVAVSPNKETVAPLLAFVDRELDRVIHPWLDGCGRFATSAVMWVSARMFGVGLPKFGTREEHYKAISTIETHTDYFLRCLSR